MHHYTRTSHGGLILTTCISIVLCVFPHSLRANNWQKVYTCQPGSKLTDVVVPHPKVHVASSSIFLNILPESTGVCVVRYKPITRAVETALVAVARHEEGSPQLDYSDLGRCRIDDISPFDTTLVIAESTHPDGTVDIPWVVTLDSSANFKGDTITLHECSLDAASPGSIQSELQIRFDPFDSAACFHLVLYFTPQMLWHQSIDTCTQLYNGRFSVTDTMPIPGRNDFGENIYRLFLDYLHPRKLWLSINDSLYVTSNGGADWTLVNRSAASDMASNPAGNLRFAVGDSGIFRSVDSGMSFMRVDTSPSQCVAMDTTTNTVYVGSRNAVLKSVDSGKKFFVYNNTFSQNPVVSVVANVSPNVLAATQEGLFEISGADVGVSDAVFLPVQSSMSAFPNPFEGSTRVVLSGLSNPMSTPHVELMDPLGRCVRMLTPIIYGEHFSLEINGEKLSTGMYFVRWREGTAVHGATVVHVEGRR